MHIIRWRSSLALFSLALGVVSCGGGGSNGRASANAVSPFESSATALVSAPPSSDGVSSATIFVTLRDASGTPVADHAISLTTLAGTAEFWPSSAPRTDVSGEVQVQMTSHVAGSRSVRVSAEGGTVVLMDEPVVEFVEPVVPRDRVSVSSSEEEGEDFSEHAAVSGNGRFVGFMSKSANLVAGDSNQKEDVFVRDLELGTTERVSLTPSGGQFTDLSGRPSLSDDGLLVAFEGRQSDDDAVFLRDRSGAFTIAISESVGLDGRCSEPSISGDGRWIALVCNDGESQQVWVVDRLTLALSLVSKSTSGQPGNDPSHAPFISRDGRWVTFASTADNLVSGDSNDKDDIFVHDRVTAVTRRVSVDAGGEDGNDDSREPSIAADGRWIVFTSKAENLVPGDDNGKDDVFRYDLLTGAMERVSVDPAWGEVDKESWRPAVSADGNYVVFSSLADDLVAGDSNGKEDVFRRDMAAGVTARVSLAQGGSNPNEFSTAPAVASDALVVAYTSKAQNLVPEDGNDKTDVFVAPLD